MADIEKERERFEAWANPRLLLLTRDADGDGYLFLETHEIWMAWQAAKSEAQADVRGLVEALERIERAGSWRMVEHLREIARDALAKHKGQT